MSGTPLADAHLDALHAVVEACAITTPEVALPWESLAAVGSLMHSDEVVFIGIDYGTRSHYFSQSIRDGRADFRTSLDGGFQDLFWRHFRTSTHQPPWIPDRVPSVTKPTDFMSEREWRNLPLYVECFREGPRTQF